MPWGWVAYRDPMRKAFEIGPIWWMFLREVVYTLRHKFYHLMIQWKWVDLEEGYTFGAAKWKFIEETKWTEDRP